MWDCHDYFPLDAPNSTSRGGWKLDTGILMCRIGRAAAGLRLRVETPAHPPQSGRVAVRGSATPRRARSSNCRSAKTCPHVIGSSCWTVTGGILATTPGLIVDDR